MSSETRAVAYTAGRLPYPDPFFEEMEKSIRSRFNSDVELLDIGCGNGRASLPLRKKFKVIAFDSDDEMLNELSRRARDALLDIPCVRGTVGDLPHHFPEKRFQVVTACSAFSLFADQKSLEAIRQVLAPDGIFIEAGDEGSAQDVLGELMQKIAKREPRKKVDPDAAQLLQENGFEKAESYHITVDEEYTYEQVFAHFKSRLAFPARTPEEVQMIREALAEHFATALQNQPLRFQRTYHFSIYTPV